jgi:hypothetical protein
VPGRFTFEPEPFSRAAEKSHIPGFDRASESLLNHEADHEDTPAFRVLDDGRQNTIQFGIIKIHIGNKKPANHFRCAGLMLVVKSATLPEHKPTGGMHVMVVVVPEHGVTLSAFGRSESEKFPDSSVGEGAAFPGKLAASPPSYGCRNLTRRL